MNLNEQNVTAKDILIGFHIVIGIRYLFAEFMAVALYIQENHFEEQIGDST